MRRPFLLILLVGAIATGTLLGSTGRDTVAPPPEPNAEPPREAQALAALPTGAPSEEPGADSEREAAPSARPHELPPDFPLNLPAEFGPGPQVRGRVVSESGQPLVGLRVRTTTWRPTGRGCFKPTWHLGRAEVRPDGGFVFHVDAAMLRDLPERKGRTPFSIEADGHLDPRIELSPAQWSALKSGRDVVGLEFRLRRAAALELLVLDENGRPCDGASVYHSKERTGWLWDYRGRTEDGVWRRPMIVPTHGGYFAARFEDFISERIPVKGRLAAGETTRLTLKLARRDPVTLTVVILGYREGLVLKLGSEEVPVDRSVIALDTLTGPHHLSVSGRDPFLYAGASIEIPRGARNHTVEMDLRP